MLKVQDEGFMPGYEEKTVFIPNYYEETIRGTSDSIQSLPDSPYKMYFPFVGGLTNSIPGATTTRVVNASR